MIIEKVILHSSFNVQEIYPQKCPENAVQFNADTFYGFAWSAIRYPRVG